MSDFLIEQAIFGLRSDQQLAISDQPFATWGRSEGFQDEWLGLAEEIMHGFGSPGGVACPLAIFAQPFGRDHVAVVQVTDRPHAARVRYSEPRGSASPEPPPPHSDLNLLAFHFLILPRQSYERFLGDPFHVAEKLPAPWHQRGTLPSHSWPCSPLPERTVDEVQRVLKRVKIKDEGGRMKDEKAEDDSSFILHPSSFPEHPSSFPESPALLGGAQVLVDGGRLVFRRPAPDLGLVHGLWTLLPASTRSSLWPASFAFGNDLDFDVVVLPRFEAAQFEGYTTEDQAMDYPEGRYELSLQIAAEHGDQAGLTALLNRRSVRETRRLATILLSGMIGLVLLFAVLDRTIFKPRPPSNHHLKAATVASLVAVRDPWTMMATFQLGERMFNKQAGGPK